MVASPAIIAKTLTFGFLALLLACNDQSALTPLVLEGHELHASLTTRDFDEHPIRHVPREVVGGNPYLSDDAAFVEAVAGGGSQGRLDRDGIRTALYALYDGEADLGIYGLEAATEADADRWESALREIWTHNVSLGRASVHRGGLVLLVVWHDGVSPECWGAVNAGLVERLSGH